MGLQAPQEACSHPVPRELSFCLQLAWQGTLLQVPEVLLRLSSGVGRSELGVGWVWVAYHGLLLADLGRKYRAFAVAIYLGSGRDFSQLTVQEIGVDASKRWLTEKPDYVRDGDSSPLTLRGFAPSKHKPRSRFLRLRFAPIKYC